MNSPSSNKYFKDLVLLFFLTLIVYWPLSLNYLSLKNDALVQYLAYRYHLSEAIRHGFLPFWSPYLYTGFPIHADMQGEVWNPFVLALSLISKYNMTILQWEVLIYLYLAAIGMYRLLKHLALSRSTAICCAVAFMCCGYMTDSVSVIPWIPSAAFIPFILLYFLRLLKSFLLSDAIKFSIALSLMFLCGYPSFFIFLNYIIAAGFVSWFIYQVRNRNKAAILKLLLYFVISYVLFLLICSPAIISYYEFLPYYSRGSGLSYAKAISNPFAPFSFSTYLLPNIASKANFLPTDLSMRNGYVGLFIFLFFLVSLKKLNRFKALILIFTLYALLFSLGDLTPVQKLSYQFLPLMDAFRHPGTMRVFTSIGLIMLAAFSLDQFFNELKEKNIILLVYGALFILILAFIYFAVPSFSQSHISYFNWSPSGLKQFLYDLPFEKFALVICILQIIFVLIFLFLLVKKLSSKKIVIGVFLLNSIVFAWIGLPFTVVSQYKTKDVNNYMNSFPDSYPLPDIQASVESGIYSDSTVISVHGYHNFYNKKITIQDHIVTPTLNSGYYTFLENKSLRHQLRNYPFVYVTNNRGERQNEGIRLLKFTPNQFQFHIHSPGEGRLQLFQQYNHNWRVKLNGQPVTIEKSTIAFMSVKIPAGNSLIEWEYKPKKVYAGIVLSSLTLLSILLYFLIKRKAKQL